MYLQHKKACSDCCYWDAYTGNLKGICRRNAPRPGGDRKTEWPVTSAEDWCGEYSSSADCECDEEYRLVDYECDEDCGGSVHL